VHIFNWSKMQGSCSARRTILSRRFFIFPIWYWRKDQTTHSQVRRQGWEDSSHFQEGGSLTQPKYLSCTWLRDKRNDLKVGVGRAVGNKREGKWNKKKVYFLLKIRVFRDVAQAVECLLCKYEALCSNLNPTKNRKENFH
jgi:hypothetical protein